MERRTDLEFFVRTSSRLPLRQLTTLFLAAVSLVRRVSNRLINRRKSGPWSFPASWNAPPVCSSDDHESVHLTAVKPRLELASF